MPATATAAAAAPGDATDDEDGEPPLATLPPRPEAPGDEFVDERPLFPLPFPLLIIKRTLRFLLLTKLFLFWISDNKNWINFSITRRCLWCCDLRIATSRHKDLLSTWIAPRIDSDEFWPSRMDLTSLRMARTSSQKLPLTIKL